jgi:hypothetical protein
MVPRCSPHRASSKNLNWSDLPDPNAQHQTNSLKVKLNQGVPHRPFDVQRSAFIATV